MKDGWVMLENKIPVSTDDIKEGEKNKFFSESLEDTPTFLARRWNRPSSRIQPALATSLSPSSAETVIFFTDSGS
eukprot:5108857-Prymnesium_polylepis.1